MNGAITITAKGADDDAKLADQRNKGAIMKNCGPFTNCRIKINYTQIDNTKNLDVAMPMYDLIEYSINQKHLGVYGKITENSRVKI